MKLRILDLYCGAGGAAMGYWLACHDAGIKCEIVGVDIKPQPRYPFTFVQADALTYPLEGFDLIHASPPCQGYSIMRNLPWLKGREYPLLIEPTRQRLIASGIPYIIENVMPAPLQANWLCGLMFGLRLFRHRRFESSFFWLAPAHPAHTGLYVRAAHTMAGRARDMLVKRRGEAIGDISAARTKTALGVEWMGREAEWSQAIPPAYTRYIGRAFLQTLTVLA